jgi:DNA-binding beta-propeller fold protein YncE
MPQGEDYVSLTAEDPLSNKLSTKVEVAVDHTAPTVALSGSVTEQAKLGTNLPQYTLKYSATDGDGTAVSALSQFSSAATGEGKLERPLGTAVDKEGNVWVVDRTNRRVEEFNESGQFVRQFGKAGSGNGEFMDPCGIAISSNGNIVVSDMTNNNLQAFTPTGQFIRTITYSGFVDPYAIAPAPGGALWVGDNAAHHVFEFSETGTLLRTLPGIQPGPSLNVPSGLATDAAGNLWVSDTAENRILKYSPSGEFIMQFGTAGTDNGQFINPTSIAVAPSGNLMVSDSTNNRLEEFQPNGVYLRKFGSLGTGLGQVTEERGLAFGPGNVLYVADAGNHRIDRWSHADLDNQSGVVSTEIKVDGQPIENPYTPGCPTENCSIGPREWPLEASNYTAGQHTLEVVATDGVGLHSPPKPLTFEVHPAQPSLALRARSPNRPPWATPAPATRSRPKRGRTAKAPKARPPSSRPSAPPARAPAS